MSEAVTKIEDATERCYRYAVQHDPPSQAASDFLMLLKGGRGWTNAEIAEVRRLVLEKLRHRSA